MSAINSAPTPLERIEWWVSCVGGCVICGSPMEYPVSTSSNVSRRRSDVDMLLFKNGLLLPMESGHLIDRYILDNATTAYDWLATESHWSAMKVKNTRRWDEEMNNTLLEHVEEARNRTVPVCRDCNVAMTNVQSEITTVFYGMLKPRWFVNNQIPYKELKATKSKATRSVAKVMEAVFVFLDLIPDSASVARGWVRFGQVDTSSRLPTQRKFLEDVDLSTEQLNRLWELDQKAGKISRWNDKVYPKLRGVEVLDRAQTSKTGVISHFTKKKTSGPWEFTVLWDSTGTEETIPFADMLVRIQFAKSVQTLQKDSTATSGSDDDDGDGARESEKGSSADSGAGGKSPPPLASIGREGVARSSVASLGSDSTDSGLDSPSGESSSDSESDGQTKHVGQWQSMTASALVGDDHRRKNMV